jgi:hypothetical protein
VAAVSIVVGCATASGIVQTRAASEFECPEDNVEVENIGGTTFRASGCGQTAVYTCSKLASGTAAPFPCVRDDPPRPSVAQPPPASRAAASPGRLRDAPSGAGGFEFGVQEADVQRVCEGAGHAYSIIAANEGACDGLALDIGAKAKARVRYCAQKLCLVSIEVEREPKATLLQTFWRLKGALVEKYGDPTKAEAALPADCFDELGTCVANQRVKLHFEWQWPSRYGIVTSAVRNDATKAVVVHIDYSSPASLQTKAPGL